MKRCESVVEDEVAIDPLFEIGQRNRHLKGRMSVKECVYVCIGA